MGGLLRGERWVGGSVEGQRNVGEGWIGRADGEDFDVLFMGFIRDSVSDFLPCMCVS